LRLSTVQTLKPVAFGTVVEGREGLPPAVETNQPRKSPTPVNTTRAHPKAISQRRPKTFGGLTRSIAESSAILRSLETHHFGY
jgi:hypothetical protein